MRREETNRKKSKGKGEWKTGSDSGVMELNKGGRRKK